MMKKSGKLLLFISGCALIGYIASEISKINLLELDSKEPNINLDQYLNRLTEFDLSNKKEATSLFLDLIENGFYPQTAFNLIQEETFNTGDQII